MANLVVRNIDEEIVQALKARAGQSGISAESLHRKILKASLLGPKKKSFAEIIKSMPNVGDDSDFVRVDNDDYKDDNVFN